MPPDALRTFWAKPLGLLVVALAWTLVGSQTSNFDSTRVPGNCTGPVTQYDCGDQCIALNRVRDCVEDCSDGSDETCPPDTVLCDNRTLLNCGGRCVQPQRVNLDCEDHIFARLCNEQNTFQCRTTANCFIEPWILDGSNECFDFSDEDPCFTNRSDCSPDADCSYDQTADTTTCTCKPNYIGDGKSCEIDPLLLRIPGSCRSNPLEFDCGNNLCISASGFRNCVPDCPDGIDEACWNGTIKCDGCKCVSVADAPSKCIDQRPQTVICDVSGSVRCNNSNNCVFSQWVLDGSDDCGDFSDEDACYTNTSNCSPDATCQANPQFSNFTCTCNRGFIGDGVTCSTDSDPLLSRIPGNCSSSPLQFDCGDTCIPVQRFRDCNDDCANGVDEQCWQGTVKCSGCKCVPAASANDICGGGQNCRDQGQFACSNNEQCVNDALVLDGTDQCTDGSDENFCTTGNLTCAAGSSCVYNPQTHLFQCDCPSGTTVQNGVCQQTTTTTTTAGTTTTTATTAAGTTQTEPTSTSPKDCADIQLQGLARSGQTQYEVFRPGCLNSASCATTVLCDFSGGGGWTVIQNRIDGSTDFWKTWQEYKNGFGDIGKNFWKGNEYVTEVTTNGGKKYELQLQMTDTDDKLYNYTYSDFSVGPESDNYPLIYSALNDAGGDPDNLAQSKDQPFGTWDQDTDQSANIHCGTWWKSGVTQHDIRAGSCYSGFCVAKECVGIGSSEYGIWFICALQDAGWWFDPQCAEVGNLNVPYDSQANIGYRHLTGINWKTSAGDVTLKSTRMQIRPQDFKLVSVTTVTPPLVVTIANASNSTDKSGNQTSPSSVLEMSLALLLICLILLIP